MRRYDRMTPLTEAEREFAEKKHPVLLWYIKDAKLNPDRWYGAAAIGYLRAVKNYCTRPELQRYSFITIARRSMMAYVCAEMKKEKRRIQTVSLNAVVAGTDGAIREDIVTYDDLRRLLESAGESDQLS